MPHSTNHNSNTYHLSDIISVWPEEDTHCIGFAKTRGRRCLLPASNIAGRGHATYLLDEGTEQLVSGIENIDEILEELAPLVLCTRWHQKDQQQVEDIVSKWSRKVHKFIRKQRPSAARSSSSSTIPSHSSARQHRSRGTHSGSRTTREPSVSSGSSRDGHSSHSRRRSSRTSHSETSANRHQHSNREARPSRSSRSRATTRRHRSRHRSSDRESVSTASSRTRESSTSPVRSNYDQVPPSRPAIQQGILNDTVEIRLDVLMRLLEQVSPGARLASGLNAPSGEDDHHSRSPTRSSVRDNLGNNNQNQQVIIINLPEPSSPRSARGQNQNANSTRISMSRNETQTNSSRETDTRASSRSQSRARSNRSRSSESPRRRAPSTNRPVVRRSIEGECHICLLPLRDERDEEETEEEEYGSEQEDEDDYTTADEDEQDYAEDEELVWCRNQCGYNFHRGCIDSWTASRAGDRQAATCPMCRARWESQ